MSNSIANDDWVKRALGIALPASTAAVVARGKLLPIWMEAKEEIDASIDKLQDAMLETGDDDLRDIAEFGLYGATDGETVRLVVALREADSGKADALSKVRDAVSDYRDFLDGAPIVDLIESNPFKVAVPLRKTLGAALSELERLAAA